MCDLLHPMINNCVKMQYKITQVRLPKQIDLSMLTQCLGMSLSEKQAVPSWPCNGYGRRDSFELHCNAFLTVLHPFGILYFSESENQTLMIPIDHNTQIMHLIDFTDRFDIHSEKLTVMNTHRHRRSKLQWSWQNINIFSKLLNIFSKND